jgi:hypothetical protein
MLTLLRLGSYSSVFCVLLRFTEKTWSNKRDPAKYRLIITDMVRWADANSRPAFCVLDEFVEACKNTDFLRYFLLPICEGKVDGVAVWGKVVFILMGNLLEQFLSSTFDDDENKEQRDAQDWALCDEEARKAIKVLLDGRNDSKFPIVLLCPSPTLDVQRQWLASKIATHVKNTEELPEAWQTEFGTRTLSDRLLERTTWGGKYWRDRENIVDNKLSALLQAGCNAISAKAIDVPNTCLELVVRLDDSGALGVAMCAVEDHHQEGTRSSTELAFVVLTTQAGAVLSAFLVSCRTLRSPQPLARALWCTLTHTVPFWLLRRSCLFRRACPRDVACACCCG